METHSCCTLLEVLTLNPLTSSSVLLKSNWERKFTRAEPQLTPCITDTMDRLPTQCFQHHGKEPLALRGHRGRPTLQSKIRLPKILSMVSSVMPSVKEKRDWMTSNLEVITSVESLNSIWRVKATGSPSTGMETWERTTGALPGSQSPELAANCHHWGTAGFARSWFGSKLPKAKRPPSSLRAIINRKNRFKL